MYINIITESLNNIKEFLSENNYKYWKVLRAYLFYTVYAILLGIITGIIEHNIIRNTFYGFLIGSVFGIYVSIEEYFKD